MRNMSRMVLNLELIFKFAPYIYPVNHVGFINVDRTYPTSKQLKPGKEIINSVYTKTE